METVLISGIGNDLKHALGIDRLGAPRINHPPLPYRLKQGCQFELAMQRQKNVGVKVHKYD